MKARVVALKEETLEGNLITLTVEVREPRPPLFFPNDEDENEEYTQAYNLYEEMLKMFGSVRLGAINFEYEVKPETCKE